MRKDVGLTIVFLLYVFMSMNAQEKFSPIKWVLRPSGGYTIPISSLSGGYITDNLFKYESNTYYWQFISSAYFFNNWGIEFSFSGNDNASISKRYDRFVNEVTNKYSDKYFVRVSSGCLYDDDVDNVHIGGSVEKGGIGPVYKIEKDRLLLIGRALIGVTSFYTDWGSAKLKGRGTNEIIQIDWGADRPVKDYLAFNPSLTIGYRLSNRIIVDFDINYWLYNIDFKYTETLENLCTGAIQTNEYPYKNMINELSFGVGMMIVIK